MTAGTVLKAVGATAVIVVVSAIGVGAVAVRSGDGRGVRAAPTPVASHDPGAAASVGALFTGGISRAHSCSASVLSSPAGDLVLTAAHCVRGTGLGMTFAPGYDDGRTPYGTWTVLRAYAEQRWLTAQDPDADLAILQVAPQTDTGAQVQGSVGAAVLGTTPAVGSSARITGYVAGSDDESISCTARITRTAGYPTFRCHGYKSGTSGSPWEVLDGRGRPTTVGVIGGLHQGGCSEHTSYSSPFGTDALLLWLTAMAGGPSDTLPTPHGDSC